MAFMNNMAVVMSAGSLQKIFCSTFIPFRSLMSHFSAFGLNLQACLCSVTNVGWTCLQPHCMSKATCCWLLSQEVPSADHKWGETLWLDTCLVGVTTLVGRAPPEEMGCFRWALRCYRLTSWSVHSLLPDCRHQCDEPPHSPHHQELANLFRCDQNQTLPPLSGFATYFCHGNEKLTQEVRVVNVFERDVYSEVPLKDLKARSCKDEGGAYYSRAGRSHVEEAQSYLGITIRL